MLPGATLPHFTPEGFEAAWLQFNSTGKLCLRIITKGTIAPLITGNGSSLTARIRAPATRDFPVTVWELQIPEGAEKLEVEGNSLIIPTVFAKISIIGDTGCRPAQKCNDVEWPFQEIAERMIAEKPDLVIHTGDYIYRHILAQQKSHPENIDRAEGDNWQGWQKEFFSPLNNVLPLAPWVFVRGNQEAEPCASEGWRRFLDGYPFVEDDIMYNDAYVVPLDKVNLVVHDSSLVHPEREDRLPENQLEGLIFPDPNPVWLLTHRPVWGIVNNKKDNDDVPNIIMNEHANLAKFLEPFPESTTTIFSGHIHAFQAIKMEAYPIHQFVIGNSGVALEEDCPPNVLRNTRLEGQKIAEAYSLVIFGYGVADHINGQWMLSLKTLEGKVAEIFTCSPAVFKD